MNPGAQAFLDALKIPRVVSLPVLQEFYVNHLDSIEEIWYRQSPSVNEETVSFSQLRNMEVSCCENLMNLVPSNMLPQLQNLQKLVVEGCPNIEFIVFNNGKEEEAADESNLIIPQLRCLEISFTENLISFYSSSTTSHAQSLFNHQVIFPVLDSLSIAGVGVIEIWGKMSVAVFEAQGSFCQLKSVIIQSCRLVQLFPSKMHPHLKELEKLEIKDCGKMEGIVGVEGLDEDVLRNEACFIKLTMLKLEGLPNLVSFCTELGDVGTTEGTSTSHAQPLFNEKLRISFQSPED